MDGAEYHTPQRLVERLQRLLEERLELVDTLERLPAGEDTPVRRDLRERLARLTREQEALVAELALAVPPDQPPTGDVASTWPSHGLKA